MFTAAKSPISGKPSLPTELSDTLALGEEKCILVVDDNLELREGVGDILEGTGYQVLTAANGQAALDLLRKKPGKIDLILSDMVMPRMNGKELYRVLREQQIDVKFIMMTGYPLENGGKELLEEGVLFWIEKPFTPDELIEHLQLALESSESEEKKRVPAISGQSWP